MTKFNWVLSILLLASIAFFIRPQNGTVLAGEARTLIDGIKAGDEATVYLRGDASGAMLSDRVPALANLPSVSGKVMSVDQNWVVIESKTSRSAIPQEAIALIEVSAGK